MFCLKIYSNEFYQKTKNLSCKEYLFVPILYLIWGVLTSNTSKV